MNYLAVGADTTELLLSKLDLTVPTLLIDDGPALDALDLPARRKVVHFDPTKHSFDVLKRMDYRRARDFVALIDAVFPEGANTLTKKNSTFLLLQALLSGATRLDKLFPRATEENQDAYQKIQTLLLSPVLKRVLTRPTNFPMDGVVLARLNRAELGDFDCFVLAHLLIGQFKGQVAITDFGFYGRDYLSYLIREERLIAGVRTLAQLFPALRQEVLLIKDKDGSRTTVADAEILADYNGLPGHSSMREAFINEMVG